MNTVQAGTRDDLRNAFLAIHASAIVISPPELAATLNIKQRYAKELIGVLENLVDPDDNPLVVMNSQAGEPPNDDVHDWYQTFYTVDDRNSEEMEALFDASVPADVKATPAPRTPRNATNPADLPACLCGCGLILGNRKRNYKPGHDARHAGQVGRALLDLDLTDEEFKAKSDAMLAALPTEALRTKAWNLYNNKLEKASQAHDKKVAKAPTAIAKAEMIPGKVKIGRWEYEAERNSVSNAVVYMKKDVATVATDKVAATFQPKEA